MNNSNFKKRILCYGDSNTWGYIPKGNGLRYGDEVRWPSVLQNNLGEKWFVIEEGLNGRTTVMDDEDDNLFPRKERNGLKWIRACVNTHKPLDFVIIMLGANDTNEKWGLNPTDIVNNIKKLIDTIFKYGVYQNKKPKTIICTLPKIYPKIKTVFNGFDTNWTLHEKVNSRIRKLDIKDAYVFDAYKYSQNESADGLHLSKKSHKDIGVNLAKYLDNLK